MGHLRFYLIALATCKLLSDDAGSLGVGCRGNGSGVAAEVVAVVVD